MTREYPSILWPWAIWLMFSALALFPQTDLSSSFSHRQTDLIENIEIYTGPSGTERLEDLDKTAFVPNPDIRSFTTSDQEIWLRFTVRQAVGQAESSLLVTSTDATDLYLFSRTAADPRWLSQRNAKDQAAHVRLKLGTRLGFDLPHSAAPTQHYLRAILPSGGSLGLAALPSREAAIQSNRLLTFEMIYFAVLIAGLLIVAYQVFEGPSTALAMLLIGHLGSIVVSLLVLELPPSLMIEDLFADRSKAILAFFGIALVPKLMFHVMFLRRFGAAGWAQGLAVLVLAILVLRIFLRLDGVVEMPGAVDPLVMLSLPLAMLALVLTVRHEAVLSLRSLRQIYLLQGVPLIVILAGYFGAVPAEQRLGFLVQAGGLMSVGLIVLLHYVAYQANDLNRRKSLTDLRKSSISRDIAASTLAVQDKLMNMLAHETRNQLALARMSMPKIAAQSDTARQAARAISDLDEVLTDSVHASWLHRGEWVARLEAMNLPDLMRPLAPAGLALDLPDQAQSLIDPMMLTTALRNLLRVTTTHRPASMALNKAAEGSWQVTLRIQSSEPPAFADGGPLDSASALSNARDLVLAMNGQFELISTEGEWTCHIWLPAR